MDRLGQPHGITVPGHVHVDDRDRSPQQVIVDGGNLDAPRHEALHHRTDLRFGEHQVAHEHRAAVVRQESHPGAERERCPDRCAIERDLEVGARKAELVHAAAKILPLPAHRLVHLAPILHPGGVGRYGAEDHHREKRRGQRSKTVHGRLPVQHCAGVKDTTFT